MNHSVPVLLIKSAKLTGLIICKRFGANCKGACLLHDFMQELKKEIKIS